jgi:TetR/AcrR family transcriptional repressor of nem operon
MLQKASPSAKRLGRRPAFDRQAVVSAAISAFWAKGFDATTTADLEAATGVDRSTIYNSFGGKTGLYRSATAAYVDSAEEVLFEPLHKGTAGVYNIVEFLDRLSANLGAGDNPQGCLIVNDMSAAAVDHRATNRYLTRLEDGLCAALGRASNSGETNPKMNSQRCQLLTGAILGVNITHRNDETGIRAHRMIGALRAEVMTWASHGQVQVATG